jgi:hypothetical protein
MSRIEDSELKRLEQALRGLTPRPANLDRDQLMYDAGRASVRRSLVWPLSAAGMTVVAGFLALALMVRGSPRVVEFVQVPLPAPLPAPPAPPPTPQPVEELGGQPASVEEPPHHSYWRLHQTATQQGIEQMLTPAEPLPPLPPSPPGPMPTAGTRGLPALWAITGDF